MSYPDTMSGLEGKIRQLEEARMQETRERDQLRAEVNRLRSVLAGIAEYCSGNDRSLGAIVRLASVHNTAQQAIRVHQQLGETDAT